jgi:D-3-phosphoglycerate dehydrogenase
VRHGAGVDLIPVDRATALGVCVGFVPGVNGNAVAEFVVAQMLAAARNVQRMDQVLHADGWSRARAISDSASELGGKTLGVVGVGSIGTRLADIAHHGFRMRVLGFRRDRTKLPPFVAHAELDRLFTEADYVVLACPLTPDTRGLASERLLARMRPTAWLLNVSRGAVVDEPALVEALAARRIAGAVLDVFATQPLAEDHPLRALPNAILTPHTAGLSAESVRAMSESAATDTLRILRGERPQHLFNADVWPRFLERRRALGWPAEGATK